LLLGFGLLLVVFKEKFKEKEGVELGLMPELRTPGVKSKTSASVTNA
jgi:hypothetical protein